MPVMSSPDAPSGSPPPFDPIVEWEGIAPPTGADSGQAGLGCWVSPVSLALKRAGAQGN